MIKIVTLIGFLVLVGLLTSFGVGFISIYQYAKLAMGG